MIFKLDFVWIFSPPNFFNVNPFHRLQFFTNCSGIDHFPWAPVLQKYTAPAWISHSSCWKICSYVGSFPWGPPQAAASFMSPALPSDPPALGWDAPRAAPLCSSMGCREMPTPPWSSPGILREPLLWHPDHIFLYVQHWSALPTPETLPSSPNHTLGTFIQHSAAQWCPALTAHLIENQGNACEIGLGLHFQIFLYWRQYKDEFLPLE